MREFKMRKRSSLLLLPFSLWVKKKKKKKKNRRTLDIVKMMAIAMPISFTS